MWMLKAILVRTQEEKERFRESLYHLREDIQAVRMLLEIWTQRVILRKSQLEMKNMLMETERKEIIIRK